MGFKKSEYRRKFKRVPTESLVAISSENARYRHDRRVRECRHEPFEWDSDDDETTESEDSELLPPTKLRLRRLELTGSARRRPASDATSSRGSSPCGGCIRIQKDRAVQTERTLRYSRYTQTDGADVLRQRLHQDRAEGEKRHYGYPRESPFEVFGKADAVDTLAGKRTFNVAAATDEVHPTALLAAHRRHPPTSSPIRTNISRPASSRPDRQRWITEYNEKYK